MSRQQCSTVNGTEALRIFLLGQFAVERNGVLLPPEVWRRRRPADLLKVLALAPDRAMHREELIDKLWPDKDLNSGANNLHRGLYDLRQILSGPWVYVDKGVVRLSRTAWVDVAVFEASVAASDPASLHTAVTLYGGDLCPDDPYAETFQIRREA